MTTDTRVAAGAVALYILLVLFLLPVSEYGRALGAATLVFGGVIAFAARVGRGPLPGMSVLAVAFVATAVLAMPTFPAMGGTVRAAVPIGFLGVQAAVLLWGALRWAPRPPPPNPTRLRTAWGVGAAIAAGLSVIATIPVLLSLDNDGRAALPLLFVYPAYFAGMLGAATVFWALQRLSHLAVGRYLIGVLGGCFLYGAIAPIVALTRAEPMELNTMSIITLLCASYVGPAVTLDTGEDVSSV